MSSAAYSKQVYRRFSSQSEAAEEDFVFSPRLSWFLGDAGTHTSLWWERSKSKRLHLGPPERNVWALRTNLASESLRSCCSLRRLTHTRLWTPVYLEMLRVALRIRAGGHRCRSSPIQLRNECFSTMIWPLCKAFRVQQLRELRFLVWFCLRLTIEFED